MIAIWLWQATKAKSAFKYKRSQDGESLTRLVSCVRKVNCGVDLVNRTIVYKIINNNERISRVNGITGRCP